MSEAERLVVVGYSFPVSDPYARSFVLKHCRAKAVEIVLGSGEAGVGIADMFHRQGVARPVNTGVYSQIYLAEGTALPDGDRFRRWHIA